MFIMTGSIPKGFIKKTLPLLATAVSTSSTMASIPINMQCADDLGCSKSIYSFVIPLGAQLNKDGHAIIIDAFQMPTEAVAIISGVFFIIDTLNTSVNTYGTLIGTYIIDKAEKKRAKKAQIAGAAA